VRSPSGSMLLSRAQRCCVVPKVLLEVVVAVVCILGQLGSCSVSWPAPLSVSPLARHACVAPPVGRRTWQRLHGCCAMCPPPAVLSSCALVFGVQFACACPGFGGDKVSPLVPCKCFPMDQRSVLSLRTAGPP